MAQRRDALLADSLGQEASVYEENQRQFELEVAAGINGQPVSLGEAGLLASQARHYRQQLEVLVRLEPEMLRRTLGITLPPA